MARKRKRTKKTGAEPRLGPPKNEQERGPEIKINFFFTAHRTAEDIKKLETVLADADIYIPEAIGHTREDQQTFRENISWARGVIREGHALDQEKNRKKAEAMMVANSGVKSYYLDVPKDHPIENKHQQDLKKMKQATTTFNEGNLEQAIIYLKEAVNQFAETQRQREAYIKQQLEKTLPQIIKRDKDLKKKKSVKVVVGLGGAHRTLFHEMPGTTRTSSKSLLVYPLFVQATNAKRLGKDVEEYDDQFYARALLSMHLSKIMIKVLHETTQDTNKIDMLVLKIVSKFSFEEIAKLCDQFKEASPAQKTEIIGKELGGKIPFFRNENELDKYLGLTSKYN